MVCRVRNVSLNLSSPFAIQGILRKMVCRGRRGEDRRGQERTGEKERRAVACRYGRMQGFALNDVACIEPKASGDPVFGDSMVKLELGCY